MMAFDNNIREIIKIIAIRYHILRLKCTNRFRLGLCPRPGWGSLQRSPSLIAGLEGPYFQGEWKGRGWSEAKGRKRGLERSGG